MNFVICAAYKGEIAATRYVSGPQKKCVCGRSSALGELTAPPDPLAGNGGGPPGKGNRERRAGEGVGEREGEGLSP